MAEPTISLIIPTIARPTLVRTLLSVRSQLWQPGDEVILVGDGHHPVARSLWDQFHLPGRYVEVPGPSKDWGHTPRNLIMPEATASYIMALDDDDILVPDAIATVRRVIAENPNRPHMFRMSGDPNVGTVWKVRKVQLYNVGTPMFVVPTDGKRWGRYESFYGGDYEFMKQTMDLWSLSSLVWREEVICQIRPTLTTLPISRTSS